MRDEHIIIIIENAPLASLGEDDLRAIRAHTRSCSDCLRAFQAAQVSQRLLKERAAVEFEPSPFFQTRVLATWREREAANNSWAFSRMWRSAGALASSMAAAVALLAVLTFVVPDNQLASQQMSTLPNAYSAEEVILDQTAQAEDLSDGQLLSTIYGEDEEASR
jgi:anti-sigma-K factor RskA